MTSDKKKTDFRDDILALLVERGPLKTICPSEVLPIELKKDQKLMELVRKSAIRLADENIIEITQAGKAVDPHCFKGPIRLKIK